MKYAIYKTINGNFFVDSEGYTSIQSALVNYHDKAKDLWNAPDVITATIAIVDENLDVALGYKERITHTPSTE